MHKLFGRFRACSIFGHTGDQLRPKLKNATCKHEEKYANPFMII